MTGLDLIGTHTQIPYVKSLMPHESLKAKFNGKCEVVQLMGVSSVVVLRVGGLASCSWYLREGHA